MNPPTFADVLQARQLLAGLLPPTPAWRYPALAATTGADVLVKHENVQPVGAFKVRGGLNLLASMPPAERERGIVGYSTGNHAQSLAYAARHFGAPCTIVMPERSNPTKVAAVRALGAELVEYGAVFDECRERAAKLAAESGARLVSAANEPEIISGVATIYVELFEQAPELQSVVVPIGSGSSASAACLVAAELAPQCEVIGVQSSAAPAAYESWRAGELVERPNRTVVEGLATGTAFELPQGVLRSRLTDFVLVDDEAIAAAQWVMLRDAHTLAEGAGAAALAAVLADPERFAGRRVAVVCSGGNASESELRRVLAAGTDSSSREA